MQNLFSSSPRSLSLSSVADFLAGRKKRRRRQSWDYGEPVADETRKGEGAKSAKIEKNMTKEPRGGWRQGCDFLEFSCFRSFAFIFPW